MESALQRDFSFNNKRRTAAILTLPPLAAFGFYVLVIHLEQSGIGQALRKGCPSSRFTGFAQVDDILCVLVNFFHGSFTEQSGKFFTADFLTSIITIITISLLEGARSGRSRWLAFPVVFLSAAQIIGGGVMSPLYWCLFSLLNTPHPAKNTTITQDKAESILLGITIGYVVPTVAMFLHENASVTAFWQAYPLFLNGVQDIFLAFRPTTAESGYLTVQITLLFCFIGSAVVHLGIIIPFIIDMSSAFWDPAQWLTFLPSLSPMDPKIATIPVATVQFLKWDEICSFLPLFIVSVLFARNFDSGITIIAWTVVASLLLGPGAALAGIWLWREACLEATRQEEQGSHAKRS